MKIDLHLHSHVSDGDLAPSALVRAAAAAGLRVIALTDHDTAAGVGQALSTAATLPIGVIPGIEISTRWLDSELHMLGYWIDHRAPAVLQHQAESLERRNNRMHRMVDRLRDMGIPISFDEVVIAAGPESRSLGRPHLARALFAAGHTRFYGEAFSRFISDKGPAFVHQAFPTPGDAIQTIHAAGGVAVWAHPPLDLLEPLMPDMLSWGIDGLECFRPMLTPSEVGRLVDTARYNGLFPTGGSDWHGPHRGPIGTFALSEDQVHELLAVGGIIP